jgi:hypothetical protein
MMHVDMVYAYPIWVVGLLLVGLAAAGAITIELVARRLLPIDTRRAHNDVAAAMFGVIGTTFAVLLAFVAMLAWEDFGNARTAATNEAAIAGDVAAAAAGLGDPAGKSVRDALSAYLHAVIDQEWPAQAAGHPSDASDAGLAALDDLAAHYSPTNPAETNYHAALIATLARLQDARAIRRLAASSDLPVIVWVVMLLGGSLTVASGSFLGAPSLRMHLAMSTTLAVSGALVVLLIVALSQPFRGDFRVSTDAYVAVLAGLEARPAP